MPSYEYEIEGTGFRFTLLRPVDDRDEPVKFMRGVIAESGERLPEGLPANPVVKRITVPQSVTVSGHARDPWLFENEISDAWKRLEERGQLPAWVQRPDAVKEAIAAPDPVDVDPDAEAEHIAQLEKHLPDPDESFARLEAAGQGEVTP